MIVLSHLLFTASLIMIGMMFLATPILLRAVYFIRGGKKVAYSDALPTVSLILVVRNAEDIIEDKIGNMLSLDYPAEKLEIVIVSDGSTDATESKARAFARENIHVFSSASHEGKIHGLNKAAVKCSGELLAFTDGDVVLERDSLLKLVKYFGDPEVGGVCGDKVVVKDNSKLEHAQHAYTKFAGSIKLLESRVGSISTNDGTLYVIRKELFSEIPPAVTDDLYVCLSVVRQNHLFMFEPEARAYMSAPSRDTVHEIRRRRRIVSQSLRGIFLLREVLNPFKHGAVSFSLFFNKVLRRLLPVFLILLFMSSMVLALHYPVIRVFLVMQTAFYLLALSGFLIFQHIPKVKMITKTASLAFYFCLGNYGTMLGLIDFLRGRQITKW